MIGRHLTRYRDTGLLFLRIGLGIAFLAHGIPKLMGGPEVWRGLGQTAGVFGVTAAPVFWGFLAGFNETAGGLCLLLGLLFRPACLILTLQMLVAIFGVHFRSTNPLLHSYGAGWSHPMELAIVFFSLLLIGPGRYSIDRQ